jgi:hypothetical protein
MVTAAVLIAATAALRRPDAVGYAKSIEVKNLQGRCERPEAARRCSAR